jgi:photosystem II stability/assembly factor-like uncharacterized protein
VRGIAALAVLAGFAGCQPGRGLVIVTVGGKASGIEHLSVVVTKDGRASVPAAFQPGADAIPPEQTLGLRFAPDVSGLVTIAVEAKGAGGATVASGSAMATVDPGGSSEVRVMLGGVDADMGADGGGMPDLSRPDLIGADLVFAFSEQVSPTSVDINTVWGSGPDDVWLGANGGRLFHLAAAGGKWMTVGHPFGTASMQDISGSGPNDVWVVGSNSTIGRWDGKAWSARNQVPDAGVATYNAVASNGTAAYVVGNRGTILHSMDQGQSWVSEGFAITDDFKAVAFSPDGLDVFAVGSGGVVAIKKAGNQAFTQVNLIPQASLRDVWIAPTGEVVIVDQMGGGLVGDPQGMNTRGMISGLAVNAVWGSSAKDVYAVGDGLAIFHSADLKSWQAVSSGGGTFYDVWGSGPGDVYAVGKGGLLTHHP